MSDIFFLIFGLVTGGLGLAIIVGFIVMKIKCTLRVTAHITSVEEKNIYVRGAASHRYKPFYTYEVEGREYTFEAPFESKSEKKFTVGDTAMLACDPKKPERNLFCGRIVAVLWGLMFLFIGAFFTMLFFI